MTTLLAIIWIAPRRFPRVFQVTGESDVEGYSQSQAGTASAQALPTVPGHARSANGGQQIEAATPLSLQEAIALALEGNLDLTVAQREIEAVEGQVIQGRVRPNP